MDSRRSKQDWYLERAQQVGLSPLLDGLRKICKATTSKRKYQYLLGRLHDMGFIVFKDGGDLSNSAPADYDIQIVYLQPNNPEGITKISSRSRMRRKSSDNTDDELSLRFAQSLSEWANVKAGGNVGEQPWSPQTITPPRPTPSKPSSWPPAPSPSPRTACRCCSRTWAAGRSSTTSRRTWRRSSRRRTPTSSSATAARRSRRTWGRATATSSRRMPRGTGDAVRQLQPLLHDFDGDLLILYGDTPLFSPGVDPRADQPPPAARGQPDPAHRGRRPALPLRPRDPRQRRAHHGHHRGGAGVGAGAGDPGAERRRVRRLRAGRSGRCWRRCRRRRWTASTG